MENNKYVSLRIVKKKQANLEDVDSHNRRLADVPNADPTKDIHVMVGGNAAIDDLVNQRIESAGAKITKSGKNASTAAVEIVISATPTYFRENAQDYGVYDKKKTQDWTRANLDFLKEKYGKNLVSFVLHLDEATPHIHAVVVPLATKERNKRRTKKQIENNLPAETYTATVLDAKNIFNKEGLVELQTEAAEAVEHLGIKRGLRGSAVKHQTANEYWSKLSEAVEEKVEINIPKYELTDKPLMMSFDAYKKIENKKLNKELKKVEKNLSKEVEKYQLQAQHYKILYEQEVERSGHFWSAFESPEKMEEKLIEKKVEREQLKNQAADLKDLLQQERSSHEYTKNEANNAEKTASETISSLQASLGTAKQQNRFLESMQRNATLKPDD